MGGLQEFPRQPNGVETEDRPFASSLSSSLPSSNPDPSSIGEESWVIAEETTQEVIRRIQPTLDSEEKRKDVIEYIQRLIRNSLGCEVFPFGSVPLKTYLPDGDIDLSVLTRPTVEKTLVRNVLAILQGEEQNGNAEYEVHDTQFIDAKVKLVKCLVQNIVIDISFNQLGGLCTLCFLEQVDRIVGKNHLFKRSIILIKAWCYYESRILGAPYGLISTYALETLILYVFHLFHTSLNGPLAVLYRFLDYFSKFDWERYCVSLKGPVCKSSLPDIVVEMPSSMDNLMLSEEFLRNCMDMFSVPSRGLETDLQAFPQKNLNIIDPLKENNNLGSSVNRGNFYRIRSAFKYGARKLGRILLSPKESIADEIKKFFVNTLERQKCNSGSLSSSFHLRTVSEENIRLNSLTLDNSILGVGINEVYRCLTKDNSLPMVSGMGSSIDGIGVSGSHLAGEMSLRNSNDTSDRLSSSIDLSNSSSGIHYSAPCFYGSSGSWTEHRENHYAVGSRTSGISSPGATTTISEGSTPLDFRETDLAEIAASSEALNPLSDLCGEYDSHIRSLLYGQYCHGHALSVPVQHSPPTFPSQFRNRKSWDTVRRSIPLRRNLYFQKNINRAPPLEQVQNPVFNQINPTQSGPALCSEEKHNTQRSGTYPPNLDISSYRESSSQWRGRSSRGRIRNQAPENHRQVPKHTRINGTSPPTLPEKKSQEGSHKSAQAGSQVPQLGKSGSNRTTQPAMDDSPAADFSALAQKLEFGSFGNLLEESFQPASDSCRDQNSSAGVVELEVQSSKAVSGNKKDRVEKQSFHLKDEDDFPRLGSYSPSA